MMSAFLSRFPQFSTFDGDADTGFMSLTLVSAAASLNRDVWGELYLDGVCCLTASMLMRDWFGQPDSIYAGLFELLSRAVHQPWEATP